MGCIVPTEVESDTIKRFMCWNVLWTPGLCCLAPTLSLLFLIKITSWGQGDLTMEKCRQARGREAWFGSWPCVSIFSNMQTIGRRKLDSESDSHAVIMLGEQNTPYQRFEGLFKWRSFLKWSYFMMKWPSLSLVHLFTQKSLISHLKEKAYTSNLLLWEHISHEDPFRLTFLLAPNEILGGIVPEDCITSLYLNSSWGWPAHGLWMACCENHFFFVFSRKQLNT